MPNKIIKLVAKYAILLSILMAIELIARMYYDTIADQTDTSSLIRLVIPYGLYLLFNLFIALIMSSDIKKMSIKADYAIALTIIARPIGICLFLIYVLGQQSEIQATS
jgi:hypothetical protein